ncbi:MAG: leucine-rich repeat domain-containing protein [Oscillospiraceae bacterium]
MNFKKLIASLSAAAIMLTAGASAAPAGALDLGGGIIIIPISNIFSYTVLPDGTAEITGVTNETATLSIPSTYAGYTVSSIGSSAFAQNSVITNLTIPSTVNVIDNESFLNASKLTSVTINGSSVIIGDRAFMSASSLTTVTFNGSRSSIGESAFANCTSLSAISIPSGCTSIGSKSFFNCTSLSAISIPNSCTSIGSMAFFNCVNLSSVVLPSGLTDIADSTFNSCSSLTSITIPASVKSIGVNAFEFCTALESVNMSSGLTTLKDSAFYSCSALKNITIPSTVTSIGNYAFAKCEAFTSFTIPSGISSIPDGLFYGSTGLASITIPENITAIGDSAFYGCTSLSTVSLPNSIKSIKNNAFYNCTSLLSISIPPSYATLYASCFGFYTNSSGTLYTKIPGFIVFCYVGDTGESYAETSGLAHIANLSKLTPALSQSTYIFSGAANKPDVVVGSSMWSTLTGGTDYTVSYSNNTNVGTATVTVTGTGIYTGTATAHFKITAKSISGFTATQPKDVTYTGAAIKPSITLKDSSKTLKSDTDYTVTYSANKAVGKATVTIKGKGNYSGTITKTFKINPKKPTLSSVTAGAKKATVKFTKVTGVTGYEIYRATSKTGTYTKVKTTTSTSYTNTGLTQGKTYYYKIRAYQTVGGVKYYSGYSAIKSAKAK